MKYDHVMLDLETKGKTPGCAILTIGAIGFNRLDQQPEGLGSQWAEFYRRVHHQRQYFKYDLFSEEDTIDWWHNRASKEAFFEAWHKFPRIEIEETLEEFNSWWREHATPKTSIWCHGLTFDVPILAVVYRKVGLEAPWDHRMAMDTRSILRVVNYGREDYEQPRISHHALEDARAQSITMQKAINLMRAHNLFSEVT